MTYDPYRDLELTLGEIKFEIEVKAYYACERIDKMFPEPQRISIRTTEEQLAMWRRYSGPEFMSRYFVYPRMAGKSVHARGLAVDLDEWPYSARLREPWHYQFPLTGRWPWYERLPNPLARLCRRLDRRRLRQ